MTLLERLLKRLDLREADEDVYLGGSGEGGVTNDARLFGGLVAAQATMAALKSVSAPLQLHSLHSYFLRSGDASRPIVYDVDCIRDGKSFTTRQQLLVEFLGGCPRIKIGEKATKFCLDFLRFP